MHIRPIRSFCNGLRFSLMISAFFAGAAWAASNNPGTQWTRQDSLDAEKEVKANPMTGIAIPNLHAMNKEDSLGTKAELLDKPGPETTPAKADSLK